MYTQCPQCLTIYCVDGATLGAACGSVRCGGCETIFDAFATLVEQLPPEPVERLPVHAVQAEAPRSMGVFLRPAKVKISAALPEAFVAGAGDSKEIRAYVVLPENRYGAYTLPVRVALPEGSRLLSVDPEEVEITLEQKN